MGCAELHGARNERRKRAQPIDSANERKAREPTTSRSEHVLLLLR